MRNHTFKGLMLGGSAAIALAAFAAPTIVAAQTATYSFNIPAQDLGAALRAYGRASRQQVVFDSRDTRGKRSTALVGTFTADAGLQQLLTGTGLNVRRGSSGVLIVTAQGAAGAAPGMDDMAASELEDVVVTGTNIRGGAAIGSPLVVITQEDIERSGAQTAAQLLETLPQNFGGGVSLDLSGGIGQQVGSIQRQSGDLSATSEDFSFGSTVNLRGLGQGTTLILVNGQRQTTAAAQQSGRPYVDISSIPLSAIERVEILTDGASAIYGADAVGGVVNFILKRDYVGAQTRFSIGAGDNAVGLEYRAAQTVGLGWGSGNAIFSYEHYHHDAVKYADLGFLDGGVTLFGTIRTGDIAPEEELDAVNLSIFQSLSPTLQAFSDIAQSTRTTEAHGRGVDPGVREETSDSSGSNDRWSATFGLRWNPAAKWSGTVSTGFSQDDFTVHQFNSTFRPVSGVTTNQVQDLFGRSELFSFDAIGNAEPFTLPGGPVRIAAGYQFRADSYDFRIHVNGAPRPVNVQNPGTVYTDALFTEVEVPLLAPLGDNAKPLATLSVAGRYEDYSNFGDTLDPRYGLRIAPTDNFIIRASYSTSFKPPSVQQLQPPRFIQAYWEPDPTEADGLVRYLAVAGGGNPDLQPETSKNITVGLDWRLPAFGGLEVRLTAYDIEYQNRIFLIPFFDVSQFNDPTLDSVRIRRADMTDAEFNALAQSILDNPNGANFDGCNWASPDADFPPETFGACSESPNNFDTIAYQNPQNIAASRDRGIDVSANQTFATRWGRFDWFVGATYILDHKQQITETTPLVDHVDQLYYPIDLNVRGGAGWSRGGWSIDAIVDYADSYENTLFSPARKVDAYTTVDFSVRRELGESLSSPLLRGINVTLNVQNVFEAQPPEVTLPFTEVDLPYDPTNANPNLRRFTITLTKEW